MKRGVAGSLSAEKLVEVLRLLEENQYYGTVLLSDGLREKCFFFTRGGLRLASSSCGSLSLPDYLRLRGVMSASQCAEHRLEARRHAAEISPRALLGRQLSREASVLEEDERSSLISEFMGCLLYTSPSPRDRG